MARTRAGRETTRERYGMRAGRREAKRMDEGGMVEERATFWVFGGAMEGAGGV